MIVSASRRTDLPAYYPDWLMGRIAAGYCLVRNPYNAKSLRRVSLEPRTSTCSSSGHATHAPSCPGCASWTSGGSATIFK